MKPEFTTTVEINAPCNAVWEVLATPELWPRWTTSMTQVAMLDGKFGDGAQVRTIQPGLRPAVWTVTEFRPGTGFTWTSRAPGVTTTGEHVVIPMSTDRTRLRLRLWHSGALARVVYLLFGGRTRRYVTLEAEGLKQAAEQQAGVSAGRDPGGRSGGGKRDD